MTEANGVYTDYSYDKLGQVTNAVKKFPDNSFVMGQQFGYQFDNIGNRTQAIMGGDNAGAGLRSVSYSRNNYMWGLDLSGGFTGAGGVGGLLAFRDWTQEENSHFYAYDGNGNVVGLVEAESGTWSAKYEYGPFGEMIRATGTKSDVNPFRFSTKYTDYESDLVYYGYRYYNPSTGRWLSRDPAEEEGGLNPYCFVDNNPITSVDMLGLWSVSSHHAAIKNVSILWGADKEGYVLWKGCVKINMESNLKLGNDRIDGTNPDVAFGIGGGFLEAQNTANSYQHAMRSKNQSVAEAEAQMNVFIDGLISRAKEKAKQASIDWDKGNKRIAVDEIKTAIYYIGKAQHPIADTTSPAHKGFQVWEGLGHLIKAKQHAAQETDEIFNGQGYLQPTVEAINARFGDAIKEILSY